MVDFLDKTLVDQLNLTEHKIEYRKHLLNFTKADAVRLASWYDYIELRVEEVVSRFYEQQTKETEIAEVIGDVETLNRLRSFLNEYILELFNGVYGKHYVNKRLRIGKIHRRMGVTPKLYISSMKLLQNLLESVISRIGRPDCRIQEVPAVKHSIQKLLLLDTQLVLDAYIDSFLFEAQTVRQEIAAYADGLEIPLADQARQLREHAFTDVLTGLYNQRALIDSLAREIAVAERHKLPLSLLYLDINNFKKVNDVHGHGVGDELLSRIGKLVLDTVRQIDIPCRYGGDEFCIVLPRTDIAEAETLSQRLIKRSLGFFGTTVSFSMGIVQCGPLHFLDLNALLKRADDLMYKAKEESRETPGNRCCIHEIDDSGSSPASGQSYTSPSSRDTTPIASLRGS